MRKIKQFKNENTFFSRYLAGAEILTSFTSKSINDGRKDGAQASNKDASKCGAQSDNKTPSSDSMESEKRNNASLPKRNMEVEAATKIQAGFRGYQVRKQLKNKVTVFLLSSFKLSQTFFYVFFIVRRFNNLKKISISMSIEIILFM